MGRTNVPVGRIAVLVALVIGLWALGQRARAPGWRTLGPGVEFAMLRGDPFCRRGSSGVALLRVDPRRTRLSVHHCSLEPGGAPLPILEWQRRTGALAVFNAGQYYPDFSYMGLLVCGGRVVSRRVHPRFRAALVAAPERGAPDAHVIDLDRAPLDPRHPGWREVAQSFMLFDRGGAPRVRQSGRVANRTVVAEDRRGRLIVCTSEGGYTLWDFARLLQRAPLDLTHAMAMDGGFEAELCVKAGRFRYASFGRWHEGEKEDAPAVGLPAVVAVAAP